MMPPCAYQRIALLGPSGLGEHQDAGAARGGRQRRGTARQPGAEDEDVGIALVHAQCSARADWKSSATSTDGAECVSAPTEMVSTPASA